MEALDPEVVVFLGFPKTRGAGRWQLTRSSPDLPELLLTGTEGFPAHQSPAEFWDRAKGEPRVPDPDTNCSMCTGSGTSNCPLIRPRTVQCEIFSFLPLLWHREKQEPFPAGVSTGNVTVKICATSPGRFRGSSELLSSGYETKFCCNNRMVLQDAQTTEQVTVVPLFMHQFPWLACCWVFAHKWAILQKMSGIDFVSNVFGAQKKVEKWNLSLCMAFSPTGKSLKSHCKSWKKA